MNGGSEDAEDGAKGNVKFSKDEKYAIILRGRSETPTVLSAPDHDNHDNPPEGRGSPSLPPRPRHASTPPSLRPPPNDLCPVAPRRASFWRGTSPSWGPWTPMLEPAARRRMPPSPPPLAAGEPARASPLPSFLGKNRSVESPACERKPSRRKPARQSGPDSVLLGPTGSRRAWGRARDRRAQRFPRCESSTRRGACPCCSEAGHKRGATVLLGPLLQVPATSCDADK